MTFWGRVYVVVLGKFEDCVCVFITLSIIFFSSSQSLLAVSVSVHDFKTIATSRQAFSHSTLKHLGTKYSSSLPLCCITSHFLNCESRNKVLKAGLFHVPLENHRHFGEVTSEERSLMLFCF